MPGPPPGACAWLGACACPAGGAEAVGAGAVRDDSVVRAGEGEGDAGIGAAPRPLLDEALPSLLEALGAEPLEALEPLADAIPALFTPP